MNSMTLLPGPKLIYRHYPMKKAQDVTEMAHRFLYQTVTLDPNLTLGDILRLFELSPALLENYHLSFSTALIEEASKGYLKPKRESSSEKLEYLALSAHWSLNTLTNELNTAGRLDLAGMSHILTRNSPKNLKKKGERIEFSLSFIPVRSLLNLPVRINPKVYLTEDDIDSHEFLKNITSYRVSDYALGCILDGIMSNLTFFGTPEESKATGLKIQERMKEVDAEDCQCAGDDFFTQFDRPGIELMFQSTGDHKIAVVTSLLRQIPNEDNACNYLESKLPGVIIKPDYRVMNAHAFRMTLRKARRPGKAM